jgi:hypothetical protein
MLEYALSIVEGRQLLAKWLVAGLGSPFKEDVIRIMSSTAL